MKVTRPRVRCPCHEGRGHPIIVGAIGFFLVVAVAASSQVYQRTSDRNAMLILVEDRLPTVSDLSRLEERRVDSILVVRALTACNELEVLSVPRDLALDNGGEVLAALYHEAGSQGIADMLERRFGLSIASVVTTDVAGVSHIASALGPVEIDLPEESLDRHTGFTGGPGQVVLEGERATAYLRSRVWEESRGGRWQVVSTSDLERIQRTQGYLRSAIGRAGDSNVTDKVRLLWAALDNSEIGVRDLAATIGLLNSAVGSSRAVFRSVNVVPERSIEQRRSPFAPDDLGASYRLLVEPGADQPFAEGCQTAGRDDAH